MFDRKILVNDAKAAFLRERDGGLTFRHGIHGRRKQRDPERNSLSETRVEFHLGGQNV